MTKASSPTHMKLYFVSGTSLCIYSLYYVHILYIVCIKPIFGIHCLSSIRVYRSWAIVCLSWIVTIESQKTSTFLQLSFFRQMYFKLLFMYARSTCISRYRMYWPRDIHNWRLWWDRVFQQCSSILSTYKDMGRSGPDERQKVSHAAQ